MDSNNSKEYTLEDGVYTFYDRVQLVDDPHAKEQTIHLRGMLKIPTYSEVRLVTGFKLPLGKKIDDIDDVSDGLDHFNFVGCTLLPSRVVVLRFFGIGIMGLQVIPFLPLCRMIVENGDHEE
jgi:hypothetical protein